MFIANAGIQIQLLNGRRNGLLRCPLGDPRIISQTATPEQSVPGKHPGIPRSERRAPAAGTIGAIRQSQPPRFPRTAGDSPLFPEISERPGGAMVLRGSGVYMFYLICPDRAVVACLPGSRARKTSRLCSSARFDAVHSNRIRDAAAIAGRVPLRPCCRFRAHPSTDPMSPRHPIVPAAPATELRRRGLRINKNRACNTRNQKEHCYRRDNCSSRDHSQPSIAARPSAARRA
jgi:hypothetical protein